MLGVCLRQAVLGEVLAGTGSDALSDERKWQIRMLLPRSDALKTLAPAVAGAGAAPAGAAPAAAAASAAQLFGGLPLDQAQQMQLLQALQLQQVRPCVRTRCPRLPRCPVWLVPIHIVHLRARVHNTGHACLLCSKHSRPWLPG